MTNGSVEKSIKFEIVEHTDSSLYRFSATSMDYLEPHFHNDFELLYPFYGGGICSVNRKSFPISAGDLFIFNPGEIHEIQTNGSTMSWLVLQIAPQYFKNLMLDSRRLLFDVNNLQDGMSTTQVASLSALLIEFGYQTLSNRKYGKVLSSSLLDLLVHSLLVNAPHHLLSESEFLHTKTRIGRLIRAVNYVENNYYKNPSLSALANDEGVSVGYMSSFFKKNFNQTFRNYLTAVRFSHAKSMIFSNKRIIDISYEVGFSDPRYLTKAFLKYENCTPNEYRIRHAEQPQRDLHLGTGGKLAFGRIDSECLLRILKDLRIPLGNRFQKLLDAKLEL